MNKYPIIGVSICAVVLMVLASLTNVVGFQTVQSSNQKIITTELNEKELLFQTIVEIANNKEIQKVILGSEITGKQFLNSGMRFSVFNHPVLTEKLLKRMFTMGVILSKTISKSRMNSMLERYQVSNQEIQNEINGVIEKDATLKGEMMQLSSSPCDCENENATRWSFPVLCVILYPIVSAAFAGYLMPYLLYWLTVWKFDFLLKISQFFYGLLIIMTIIGSTLNCFWKY